jgi:uncharacterized protein
MDWILVIGLGVLAGGVTTVAGMGGGMLLVAALALMLDPLTALSATAIGLLVGNLHRVWMYRQTLSWTAAGPMVAGAVPGALLAGLVIAWLPTWLLFGLMLALGVLGAVRQLGGWTFSPPAWSGVPLGVVTGTVTATSGGGGLLVAPWVLSHGLVGGGYVGTVGLIAASLHIARIVAYGLGGASGVQAWAYGAVLAVLSPVGNLLGHAVRERLDEPTQRWVQVGALALLLGIAAVGLAGSAWMGG